jgi:hypothetical protein
MKPIIQIWVPEQSLAQIARDKYPSTWWRKEPGPGAATAVCINVSADWFVQMRDAEKELEKENDLPF